MKKMATFIVITLIGGGMLTGCSSNRNENNDELYNLCVNLEEQIQELQSENETMKNEMEKLSTEISSIKERNSLTIKSETTVVSDNNESETTTQKESCEVQNISLQDEKIYVSVIYNNESIPINAYPEAKRDTAISEPYSLIVPESGRLRDISFIISGITVKDVYVVDKQFQKIEDIKYSNVDNTYSFYYYMPGGGLYTFLVTTVNGTHYYFSVLY